MNLYIIPTLMLHDLAMHNISQYCTFFNKTYIKVILYSYLILKKINERITDS